MNKTDKITLKIKKLNEKAILPARATPGSAGLDLYALLDEDLTIPANGRAAVPTGIAIELPDSGYAAFIFPRSGLASKHGLALSNCVGVVDSDYRGEIKVAMINHGDNEYTVKSGERVAQMVIMPVPAVDLIEVDGLGDTERGGGGFGSTGKE